jgi:hypothetical protein
MQASTVLLTNESGASTVNVPSMANVKIEATNNDVLVLLDSDDEVCPVVDLSDTSYFLDKTKSSNPILVSVDVDKTPHSSSYMKFVRHGSSFQRPPLHHSSSSSSFNIVDALKMTKSRRRSKSDLTAIDFDSIDVREVKYLPPSFDGDVIFILPLIFVDVSSTYGRSMDGMDKMCDGHPWCTTKTTNIQNDFGLFLDVLHVPVIYSAQIHTVIICIAMEVFATAPNGLDRLLCHLLWEMLPQKSQDWNVRYIVQRRCVLRCVMLAFCMFTLHPQRCQELVYI